MAANLRLLPSPLRAQLERLKLSSYLVCFACDTELPFTAAEGTDRPQKALNLVMGEDFVGRISVPTRGCFGAHGVLNMHGTKLAETSGRCLAVAHPCPKSEEDFAARSRVWTTKVHKTPTAR